MRDGALLTSGIAFAEPPVSENGHMVVFNSPSVNGTATDDIHDKYYEGKDITLSATSPHLEVNITSSPSVLAHSNLRNATLTQKAPLESATLNFAGTTIVDRTQLNLQNTKNVVINNTGSIEGSFDCNFSGNETVTFNNSCTFITSFQGNSSFTGTSFVNSGTFFNGL